MNRVLVSILSSLLMTTHSAPADEKQEKNVLVCFQPTVHKGRCKAGVVLSHTFELRNTGRKAVTILRVENTCGCIRLDLSSRELRAGDQALLTVEIATLNQPEGIQRWPIRLHYQYPSSSSMSEPQVLELVVQAQIVREIDIQPSRLIISTHGATRSTITITDRRPKPLTISKIWSPSPFVSITVQKPHPGQFQLTLETQAQIPEGEHDASVSVGTDDAEYREIRIPVLIVRQRSKPLVITPEEVIFHLQPGQVSSQIVQIRSLSTDPVRIVEASCDHPAVQVKFPQEASRVSAIRISLSSTAATTPGTALIRLQLLEPRAETILVPIRWTLHRPDR